MQKVLEKQYLSTIILHMEFALLLEENTQLKISLKNVLIYSKLKIKRTSLKSLASGFLLKSYNTN